MAKAGENNLINDENVTEVVKAYHEVKNTYYQMLITYRIKRKANGFHSAVDQLKQAADAAAKDQDKPKLKALNEKASGEMGNLEKASSTLKTIDLGTGDAQIVQKYLAVAEKYNALMEKAKEQNAEDVSEVKAVKETFEALQKSYENVIKLRVQELAQKAQKLKQAANNLAGAVGDLNEPADLLKDAAMSSPDGLKEKADDLVNAINDGGDTDGTKAGDVIKQFDTVTEKYEKLISKATEKGKQANVKAVYDAYTNLKSLYDQMLYFTKLAKKAEQLDTKAKLITSPDTAQQFKDKLDAFGNVYNSTPAADIKSIFQSDFEYIKNVVYEAQSEKMQL